MSRYELSVLVVVYLVWILICVSNIPIAKIIRSLSVVVWIGTIIANDFDRDMIIFVVLLFHPIYIKWIGKAIMYLFVSKSLQK